MNKDQEAKAAKRRDFLRLAGLGTLSGAAAATALGGGDAKAEVETGDRARGYRETTHVKKVYELSRF